MPFYRDCYTRTVGLAEKVFRSEAGSGLCDGMPESGSLGELDLARLGEMYPTWHGSTCGMRVLRLFENIITNHRASARPKATNSLDIR